MADLNSWVMAAAKGPKDKAGNVAEGDCVLVDTKNSIVLSSQPDHLVAVLGIEDCVVVHMAGATLVCRKNNLDDLRKLEELRPK